MNAPWIVALTTVAAAGASAWWLWWRAATYCAGGDALGMACSVAMSDATTWSWVAAAAAAVVCTGMLVWARRSVRTPAASP